MFTQGTNEVFTPESDTLVAISTGDDDSGSYGEWETVPYSYSKQLEMDFAEMTKEQRDIYLLRRREHQQRHEESQYEINNDPMMRYLHETEVQQRQYARRLSNDSQRMEKLKLVGYRQAMEYTKRNWRHDREPTIIRRNGRRMTDEDGNPLTKRMTFRQYRRLTRDESQHHSAVERNAEDGNFKKRKEWSRDFIQKAQQAMMLQGLNTLKLSILIGRSENDLKRLFNLSSGHSELDYNQGLHALLTNRLGL